jgi:thiol-disulfide isomerase/thioredoxin
MRLVALMLAVFAAANTAHHAFAEIAWHTDLTKAHVEAQKLGKPMLLHFYTDNCVFCDKLEAGAFQNPDVQSAIGRGFVPVKIHAAQQPKLALLFKVNRFPTDVIVTTEGDAMSHKVSPQKPADYVQMLTACAKTAAPAASPKTNPLAAKTATIAVPTPANPATQTPANAIAQTAATVSPGARMPGFEIPTTVPVNARAIAPVPASTGPAASKSAAASMPTNQTLSSQSKAASGIKASTKNVQANADMELALEGFCAVTLLTKGQWIRGNPEFGVVHLGKLYLFNDTVARDAFLVEPIKYTPMLNGVDVVRFFEEKTIVNGKREHCVIDPDHNRIYMFADEQALAHFEETFDRYLDTAMNVMDQAVKDSNPR